MVSNTVELDISIKSVLREAFLILIDQALDQNDKEIFLLLSKELQQLDSEE